MHCFQGAHLIKTSRRTLSLSHAVMREVSAEDDFQENLDQTRDRVDAIESLHRTNELVIKDNEGVFKIAVGRG